MQIVLLERIEKLGQMGDVVDVKPGFARNFLLPQNKALRATPDNLKDFENRRTQIEADNLKLKAEAEAVAGKLDGLQIVMIRSAGESGQLYGSVNAKDVAAGLGEAGFSVTRQQVVVDRPVKILGFHEFRIRLHPEVSVGITVNTARSEAEAEEQKRLGRGLISSADGDDDAGEAAIIDEEIGEMAVNPAAAVAVFDEEHTPEAAEEASEGSADASASDASSDEHADASPDETPAATSDADGAPEASEETPEETPGSTSSS